VGKSLFGSDLGFLEAGLARETRRKSAAHC
jgi:hypothetical protein